MRAVTQEEFRVAIETIRVYKEQLDRELTKANKELEGLPPYVLCTPETPFDFDKLGMSCRLYNVLRSNMHQDPKKLGDFEGMSLNKISQYRGMGENTINELKEICKYAGVNLIDDIPKPKKEKFVFPKIDLSTITTDTLIAKSGLAPKSYSLLNRYLFRKGVICKDIDIWQIENEYALDKTAKIEHLENINIGNFIHYGAGKKTIEDIKKICNHLNIPYIE